ncbi:MAG: response regulator transcription factor [bacterium]
MIEIMIADDHPIVRNGLKQIIADEKDMHICCEASNTDEIFELLKIHHTDVIVLDISMPGQNGFDALVKLRQNKNKIHILILSGMSEEVFAKRSFEAGAAGYMHKECAPEELVNAIRKVYNGGKYISNKLAESMAEELINHRKNNPHEMLSEREFQIFLQIGSGKRVGEIADIMNLGINTISTYRKRIIKKTGLRNNSEIIFYCMNANLLKK